MSRGWAKASACRLQITLFCAVLCHIVSLSSGDTRGPSVVFEAVDMPCPRPFHFSHSVHYIDDFCPLPDPDVGPSIFVCDVEHTSFHFGMCGRKFVLCLFGQCPGLGTIGHSWQHTGVAHLRHIIFFQVQFSVVYKFNVVCVIIVKLIIPYIM